MGNAPDHSFHAVVECSQARTLCSAMREHWPLPDERLPWRTGSFSCWTDAQRRRASCWSWFFGRRGRNTITSRIIPETRKDQVRPSPVVSAIKTDNSWIAYDLLSPDFLGACALPFWTLWFHLSSLFWTQLEKQRKQHVLPYSVASAIRLGGIGLG